MKQVAKYNLFKGISTMASIGTPLITLLCCSDFFIHKSETSISAAGIFTLLIMALFFKDKIAENFKVPSVFVISIITLIGILLIENIVEPIKIVCIATIITSGIDELTFKRMYKTIEAFLPENTKLYKKFGFIFTTTDNLLKEKNDGAKTNN